jgi:hypothetical protein
MKMTKFLIEFKKEYENIYGGEDHDGDDLYNRNDESNSKRKKGYSKLQGPGDDFESKRGLDESKSALLKKSQTLLGDVLPTDPTLDNGIRWIN